MYMCVYVCLKYISTYLQSLYIYICKECVCVYVYQYTYSMVIFRSFMFMIVWHMNYTTCVGYSEGFGSRCCVQLCPGFNFIRIMATVLTASLLPKGNGETSLTISNSFTGEDLCSFNLQADMRLADLEKNLCDPSGPMFRCLPKSRLCFYTEKEPLKTLDLQLQLCTFASLVIQYRDMETLLQRFPDIGKFLEAMQGNKFDPSSSNFQISWTAAGAPAVSAYQTECLVDQILSESPVRADSREHFVQIFGKLTAFGESWKMFNLALLRNYNPGVTKFKHCLCQHWVQVAHHASTSMISEATPIILLKRNDLGDVNGCSVIGDSFPSNFDDRLQQQLMLETLHPNVQWREVSCVLLSMDWDPQEGLASLKHLLEKSDQPAPAQFMALQRQEVSQMVHVQLRLSCCGFAQVQGPINVACMEVLSELLEYKLKILKFQSVTDLETQMSGFEGDAQHRGTLVLVTDLPPSTGPIFGGPHRMVLCCKAEEQT